MPYFQRQIRPTDALLFDENNSLVGMQSGQSDERVLWPSAYSFGIGELPAAQNRGVAARFGGIGPSGNIVLVSDGTNWRPQNGSAVLYQSPVGSIAAPVATLTGNGAIQYFTLPTPMRIPQGLLYSGAKLRIVMFGIKQGTHTGAWRVGVATAADASGYQSIMSTTSSASAGSYVRGTTEIVIGNGAFFTTGTAGMEGSAGTSTSVTVTDRTFATMLTADVFVLIGIEASYTDSAAGLIHYSVTLEG